MSVQSTRYLKGAAYGLAVLAGTLGLGFVLAPWLGTATGLFAIDVESAGFFSMLTLKGLPYLVGLGVFSAGLYERMAGWRLLPRIGGYAANVLAAWLVAAGIALVLLG